MRIAKIHGLLSNKFPSKQTALGLAPCDTAHICTGNSGVSCHWSQVGLTIFLCSHMSPAKHGLHRSTKQSDESSNSLNFPEVVCSCYTQNNVGPWTEHEKEVRKNSFWQLRGAGDTSAGRVCQVSAIFARGKSRSRVGQEPEHLSWCDQHFPLDSSL